MISSWITYTVHMFILETLFFSNKGPGSASLDAALRGNMCGWPMGQACWGPVSPPGSVLALARFILLLLLSCGTQRRAEPRLSHSCLALLHISNNANYISNCNRWGLVSSSHSLERFINIHQRGHWSVWATTFKGWTSQGAEGPTR